SDRELFYQYNMQALVKFKDGSEELVNLPGTLVMEEIENEWKIKDFEFDRAELANVLQFGKSYLFITNHSNAPIRRVEYDARGHSGGVMHADNTDLEKNAQVDFEMADDEDLDFVVTLLDKNGNTLARQGFTGDFTKGKDVHLTIEENSEGDLMINPSTIENEENSKYMDYYNAKVQYAGDNSKVINLLNTIGFNDLGQ